jgi:HAD superfamily hydrolase (TIGR01509 family)
MDLIIFDCDGVLVDSEPIANRIFAAMLTEIGLPTSYEDSLRDYMGRSMLTCMEIVQQRLNKPAPADFLQNFHDRCTTAFHDDLRPVPGIIDALNQISRPFCVASSGDHIKIRTTLGITGLLPRFENQIFSAYDVERGKPFPDLFLYAAKTMGADPKSCVVVEDSIPGVQAGIAAGMIVFGYAGRSQAQGLAAAGARTFTDMRDLPELLASLEHTH